MLLFSIVFYFMIEDEIDNILMDLTNFGSSSQFFYGLIKIQGREPLM